MPRILRITNRLNLGGPTYNVALLTKHVNDGYQTQLLAGMKDASEACSAFILNDLGLNPRYIDNMYRAVNPIKDIPAYREIKRVIEEYQPDIVHTHAAKSGALGRLAAKACNVPVITHTFHGHVFHSYFGPLKTRFYLEVERYLASFSSKIIAISHKQKAELAETYKLCAPEKIQVVPLGFDLSRFQEDQVNKRIEFRQKYNIADDEVAIAIVGRLVPIKNHGLFLQALKEVIDKSSRKIRAFIVGDGECKASIEQKARELGIPFTTEKDPTTKKAPLTFTSWIKAVDYVYAGVDIVTLSSLNEGTPVSLIEAQAANKPIVTTDVGGVGDVVMPGKTALLSPSKDYQQFAQHLLTLVENEAKRQAMGDNSARFVEYRYSYRRLANDMQRLYDQLLWNASPKYHDILSKKFAVSHKVGAGRAPLGYASRVTAVYK